MSIRYVILGFLSESELTGYDLKKTIAASRVFHWSGNNNQIYKSLVELHEANLVTVEIQYQSSKPPRKVYTITDAGREALREWLATVPALPQFQIPLLVQLTWAGQLSAEDLSAVLAKYEEELQTHIALLQEQVRRASGTAQANTFTERTAEHWIALHQLQLDWVHALRQEVPFGKDEAE